MLLEKSLEYLYLRELSGQLVTIFILVANIGMYLNIGFNVQQRMKTRKMKIDFLYKGFYKHISNEIDMNFFVFSNSFVT